MIFQTPQEKQFKRIFEDDTTISVWKYDLDINPFGPISVTIKNKITNGKENKNT